MVASIARRDPKGSAKNPVSKAATKNPTRVLIVDDHAIVRAGIIDILRSHDWLVVVGEAADGREALTKALQLAPDLIVVDLNLPKLSGVGLMKSLRTHLPETKVVVLSMHEPDRVASLIFESGARGYVSKRVASSELVTALESVAGGGTYFDSTFSASVIKQHSVGTAGQQPAISPRQRDVLVGVAEGLTSKEIAARLNIGVRTVDTHREQVARKLHIHNAADFTKYAVQQGFILL